MFFPTLQLTPAGQALLVKVIGDGKVLTFSRMAIGDGTAPGTAGLTHQAINIPINYYTPGIGAVSMTGTIDNSSLQSGVNARELGVFAIDPDTENEIMYAYAYNSENPAYIPPASSSSYERIALTTVVAIGSAQDVKVELDPFIGYATTEQFNAHVNDTENPHEVTKAQVGLGNVPNVSTDNQTPTFTEADTLANIASGETLKVIFGKIKKAISSLVSHLSASNPHGITPGGIGAALAGHNHSIASLSDTHVGSVIPDISIDDTYVSSYYAIQYGNVVFYKFEAVLSNGLDISPGSRVKIAHFNGVDYNTSSESDICIGASANQGNYTGENFAQAEVDRGALYVRKITANDNTLWFQGYYFVNPYS